MALCHACPPYDFDTDAVIRDYGNVYLLAEKITLTPEEEEQLKGMEDISESELFLKIRRITDHFLLAMEDEYSGSLGFFAGTCRFCASCSKTEELPCRYPEKMRSSLESYGFDIGKTCSELLGIDLQWIEGEMPEYFVLVSGFFTDAEICNLSECAACVFRVLERLEAPENK